MRINQLMSAFNWNRKNGLNRLTSTKILDRIEGRN